MNALRMIGFEFRYNLFSLQAGILTCVLFGLALLFTANGVEFQSTARGGNVFINSPYALSQFHIVLTLLATFIAPAFMANALLKDSGSLFDAILFATPLTKTDYLTGRFFGAFLALVLVCASWSLGMLLGTFWPWAEPETLASTNLSHYIIIFGFVVLPSLFTISALIFAVAALSRSQLVSYLAALGLLFLFITVDTSTAISSLWDPFMADAFDIKTKYWTAAERNSQLVSIEGELLHNRITWLIVSIIALIATFSLFSFEARSKRTNLKHKASSKPILKSFDTNETPLAAPLFNGQVLLAQLKYRIRFEILSVFKSLPFLALLSFALFILFFALIGRETLYDIDAYPLTRLMIYAIQGSLTFALMAVLAFYSADLIWREKQCKFSEIIDALPVPNSVFVTSKLVALALVMFAIVGLGIVIAVSLQVLSGHHELQLGLYLERGLIYYTLAYIYLAILTCFFQVLANNRLMGILFFVLFIALMVLAKDIFGFEHVLISYGLPGIAAPLSDMNADDRFSAAGYWLRLYWGAIAGLLLLLTYALWQRGTPLPLKTRMTQLFAPGNKPFKAPAIGFSALVLASASFIFYNTNVLNDYRTRDDIDQLKLAYEQKYRQYEQLPMPSVIDVNIEVDLYPYQRRIVSRSTQLLQNKTDSAIETVHLTFASNSDITKMELEGASLSYSEDGLGYYIFDLAVPMQPGEIRELKFDALMQKQGFRNGRRDIRLVRNGTFIHNDQLTPHVGFFPGLMIEDNKTRQKLGLAPLPRMPKLEDSTHYSTNGLRYDSDFIQFETTVSTVSSQIAVAPGYLQKEWQEGERRYFHYKMDAPMMNFYSFLSAEYRVKKDKWRDVDIQVLYHPAHEYNVDRMISGVKESLSYFSDNFSPYQYKQLRILEFPGYRQFAQAFPNTVPFSESIGFVADVSDPEVIDLPFYVTAHEVAHQWWGYQVMAAQVQGNSFIIETLSQYSALLVMEQKYGKHQVHKFLELERDKYLTGRTKDAEGELPLYRVEDQSYIHYRKGAIAMYALKDYLGEDTINKAIRRFIEKHANRSNRYAISTDFIDLLKEEITSKDEAIVADMLEKITLFDLKVLHSTATKLDSGQFKVSVQLEASKYYDDELAPEQIALGYPVEIGLFSANPLDKGFNKEDVISVEKYALDGKRASIEIMVDKRPEFVGVDPYLKLIDREIDDNIREVEFEAQPEQAFAKLNN